MLPGAVVSLETTVFHESLVGVVAGTTIGEMEHLLASTVAPSFIIPVAAFELVTGKVCEFTLTVLFAILEFSFEL